MHTLKILNTQFVKNLKYYKENNIKYISFFDQDSNLRFFSLKEEKEVKLKTIEDLKQEKDVLFIGDKEKYENSKSANLNSYPYKISVSKVNKNCFKGSVFRLGIIPINKNTFKIVHMIEQEILVYKNQEIKVNHIHSNDISLNNLFYILKRTPFFSQEEFTSIILTSHNIKLYQNEEYINTMIKESIDKTINKDILSWVKYPNIFKILKSDLTLKEFKEEYLFNDQDIELINYFLGDFHSIKYKTRETFLECMKIASSKNYLNKILIDITFLNKYFNEQVFYNIINISKQKTINTDYKLDKIINKNIEKYLNIIMLDLSNNQETNIMTSKYLNFFEIEKGEVLNYNFRTLQKQNILDSLKEIKKPDELNAENLKEKEKLSMFYIEQEPLYILDFFVSSKDLDYFYKNIKNIIEDKELYFSNQSFNDYIHKRPDKKTKKTIEFLQQIEIETTLSVDIKPSNRNVLNLIMLADITKQEFDILYSVFTSIYSYYLDGEQVINDTQLYFLNEELFQLFYHNKFKFNEKYTLYEFINEIIYLYIFLEIGEVDNRNSSEKGFYSKSDSNELIHLIETLNEYLSFLTTEELDNFNIRNFNMTDYQIKKTRYILNRENNENIIKHLNSFNNIKFDTTKYKSYVITDLNNYNKILKKQNFNFNKFFKSYQKELIKIKTLISKENNNIEKTIIQGPFGHRMEYY